MQRCVHPSIHPSIDPLSIHPSIRSSISSIHVLKFSIQGSAALLSWTSGPLNTIACSGYNLLFYGSKLYLYQYLCNMFTKNTFICSRSDIHLSDWCRHIKAKSSGVQMIGISTFLLFEIFIKRENSCLKMLGYWYTRKVHLGESAPGGAVWRHLLHLLRQDDHQEREKGSSRSVCWHFLKMISLLGLQKPRQEQLWLGQALETICEQVFGLTISNVVTTFY